MREIIKELREKGFRMIDKLYSDMEYEINQNTKITFEEKYKLIIEAKKIKHNLIKSCPYA